MGKDQRDATVRMFLFPGMGHCSGGDGPSEFPLLQGLMAWVEGGEAPQVMIAHRAVPTAEGLPVGVGAPPKGMPGGGTATACQGRHRSRCRPARSVSAQGQAAAAQPTGLCLSRHCPICRQRIAGRCGKLCTGCRCRDQRHRRMGWRWAVSARSRPHGSSSGRWCDEAESHTGGMERRCCSRRSRPPPCLPWPVGANRAHSCSTFAAPRERARSP